MLKTEFFKKNLTIKALTKDIDKQKRVIYIPAWIAMEFLFFFTKLSS